MELPLQQHPTFGTVLGLIGTRIERIDLHGAAPTQIIRRFGLGFAPRGPVWVRENPDALRNSPIRVLNAEQPGQIYRQAGFRQIMTAAYVAELDLRGTPDTRQAKLHGKWRNAWRKSQRCKLKLHQTRFDPALHGWLLQADRDQQQAKRFRALPHSIIHAYAAISPRDVIVFTAKQKHDVIAAMLFLQHSPVVTYHLGCTGETGRVCNAHHALLLHAADHFAENGFTRLDLGTVDTENTPGLARFKIGSGATVRPLGGTWLRLPFA